MGVRVVIWKVGWRFPPQQKLITVCNVMWCKRVWQEREGNLRAFILFPVFRSACFWPRTMIVPHTQDNTLHTAQPEHLQQ